MFFVAVNRAMKLLFLSSEPNISKHKPSYVKLFITEHYVNAELQWLQWICRWFIVCVFVYVCMCVSIFIMVNTKQCVQFVPIIQTSFMVPRRGNIQNARTDSQYMCYMISDILKRSKYNEMRIPSRSLLLFAMYFPSICQWPSV